MRTVKSIGNSEPERFFTRQYINGVIDVHENGLVYNTKTNRFIGATGSGGYPKISMANFEVIPRKILHIQIHRLVWLIYGGDIPNDWIVNHKDGIKSNCSITNLECITKSENRIHAQVSGLQPSTSAHLNGNASFSRSDIYTIRQRLSSGESQSRIALDYGVSKTTINYIHKRKTYNYPDL